MLIALSRFAAFKSGILSSAIFWISAFDTLPTLFLFGTPDPDLILAAFFNKIAAGGVLVIKLKLLS